MYAPAPAGRTSDRTPLLVPKIASVQHSSHQYHRRINKRHPVPLFSIIFTSIILLVVAFLAWDVSIYGHCYVKPLCRALSGRNGLEQTWWRNQGPYSPFRSQGPGGGDKGLPKGCELSQVTILHRHGARYPTAGSGQCILSALQKIENRQVKVPRGYPEFSFLLKEDLKLSNWKFDELMDQGRKQSWISGRTLKQQYKQFLGQAEGIFTRSSGGGRVVETAGYWLEGFRGERFKLKKISDLPQVDVVIPEGEEYNNTLSVHSCPAFQNLNPKPSEIKFKDFSPLLEPTLNRLNNILKPQPLLEMEDLICLADMCGYDSQSKGENWEGWSKWCSIFNKNEWELFGHLKDLKRWYDLGEKSKFGKTLGSGYTNELLARFKNSKVFDNTSTNHTLNSNEKTFPKGGNFFFIDFGHDNEILEIISTINLLNQHRPLPINSIPLKRTYIISKIVPFGAKLTFERISCKIGNWEPDPEITIKHNDSNRNNDGKRDYIRILINDKIESGNHPSCEFSGLADFGLCELDSFVESQSFARELVDWSICYEDQNEI